MVKLKKQRLTEDDKRIGTNTLIKQNQKQKFKLKYKTYWNYKTMIRHCLKYKKDTEGKNRNVAKSRNERIMVLLKCTVCNTKKE